MRDTATPGRCAFARRPRRGLLLGTPGVLALLGWVLLAPQRQGVLFEGRSVDQWLNGGFVDASRALYEVGPEAIPDIFRKLLREHPQYGYWQRYRSAWEKVPMPCRGMLPRPKTVSFDEWRACNALVIIGPRAVPSLARGLEHRSALVRATSAQALCLLGQRGSDLRKARPALEKALRDRSPDVRRHALTALESRS